MNRIAAFAYGVVSYLIFFATFLYLIGFVGNLVVPKSLDSGVEGSVGAAFIINLVLLLLFGIQHSVMARPAFKERWTKIVPQSIERSTYTLFSSLALVLMYWQWRPMTGAIWQVEGAAGVVIQGLMVVGFAIVLVSTFLIDHFDLFGLRQVLLNLRGKEYSAKPFMVPLFYRFVRHPLYLGFLIAFWATPSMTHGHLLFAAVNTLYIFIAIPMEEKDLVDALGDSYRHYQQKTPMIFPRGISPSPK